MNAEELLQTIAPSIRKTKHQPTQTGITTTYPIVTAKNIIVDSTIQRNLNVSAIQKIVNNFDWTKVKTLICISDDTNDMYVVDGQHTLMAILYLYPNAQITIQLHKFSGTLTQSQRTLYGSNLFLSCNKGIFTPVNKFYTLRAAMIAGNSVACDIFDICDEFGITLTPNSASNPLELSHISHIEKTYKEYGKLNLEKALNFYSSNFKNDIIDGSMMKALARFFFVYGNAYDESLAECINDTTFSQMSKGKKAGCSSVHDLSNDTKTRLAYMNYYDNLSYLVPANHDIRHAWTFGNILKNNNIDINLSLLE